MHFRVSFGLSAPRPRRQRTALGTVAFGLLWALTACGKVPAEKPSSDSTPARVAIALDSATNPDSAFRGTTGRTERADTGTMTILHDVRAARHENFARVVFEFRERVPGSVVQYEKEPSECGSGMPAAPTGTAYLSVRFFPSQAHAAPGDNPEAVASTIRDRNRRVNLHPLLGLRQTCDFEGVVTWVLGLADRRGYRVLTLESPPRLVVDISP